MNQSKEYLRVLVVDDSAVSRKLAHFAFLGRPYDVSIAENGEQALDLFASHRPDVVITDWQMPGMSGLELCRTIRKKLHCQDTFLILLTSNSGENHMADALAAGADGFLLKPLQTDELLAKLNTARGVLKTRREMTAAKNQL